MALRMGGAKEAVLGEEETIKRVLNFLEHCGLGKVTANETIRIRQNRESTWTRSYTSKWKEPCCFFTTGFFNGASFMLLRLSMLEKQGVLRWVIPIVTGNSDEWS